MRKLLDRLTLMAVGARLCLGQHSWLVPPDPMLREGLREGFAWRGDRGSDGTYADLTGLWRDGELLAGPGSGASTLPTRITEHASLPR